jgi:hypothetical protein
MGVGVHGLSPTVLSAFVAERSGARLAMSTVRDGCGVLSVFLRYAHRVAIPDATCASLSSSRRSTGSHASRDRFRGPRWNGCLAVLIGARRAASGTSRSCSYS